MKGNTIMFKLVFDIFNKFCFFFQTYMRFSIHVEIICLTIISVAFAAFTSFMFVDRMLLVAAVRFLYFSLLKLSARFFRKVDP